MKIPDMLINLMSLLVNQGKRNVLCAVLLHALQFICVRASLHFLSLLFKSFFFGAQEHPFAAFTCVPLQLHFAHALYKRLFLDMEDFISNIWIKMISSEGSCLYRSPRVCPLAYRSFHVLSPCLHMPPKAHFGLKDQVGL
jgi:hypothetical protein